MDYIDIYILLFKVKNYSNKWIVKISDTYRELKDIIRYVDKSENKIGNYYIVRRLEKESLLYSKFKQFEIYKEDKNDELLFTI